MKKTVVVTGAHGFIGRHVSRLLSQLGYRVVGIGHGDWQKEEVRSWGLDSWCMSDVTVKGLAECAERPYAIVHLAGGASVPASMANPLSDFERTVVTTANVLEFVRSHSSTTRVVYPSSASIYGNASSFPISEADHPSPISPYGLHKWLAEQMLVLYASQYHISSCIVRLFSVYGTGLRKQLLWDACRKLSHGGSAFMGSGTEIRDWLHVEDAATLLVLAILNSSFECPTINGGTGSGVSVREILTMLCSYLQVAYKPEFSGTQRSGDPTCLVADTTRACLWGWRPERSLNDGLSDYVSWWRLENLSSHSSLEKRDHPLTAFSAEQALEVSLQQT